MQLRFFWIPFQEAIAGKPYDVKADMFSFGCLLYELCALWRVSFPWPLRYLAL
jgi:hypothetical protein